MTPDLLLLELFPADGLVLLSKIKIDPQADKNKGDEKQQIGFPGIPIEYHGQDHGLETESIHYCEPEVGFHRRISLIVKNTLADRANRYKMATTDFAFMSVFATRMIV